MKVRDDENSGILETKRSEELTKNILLKQSYINSKKLRKEVLQRLRANDKELTELDLSGYDFKPGELKELLDALKTNSIITKLNLSYSNIGYDGAKIIADLIRKNKSLREIDLFSNNIGDKGVQIICSALESSNISYLDLSFNNIGIKGTKIIADFITSHEFITLIDLELGNMVEMPEFGHLLFLASLNSNDNNIKRLIANDAELTELDLSQYFVNEDELKDLVKAFKNNSFVTKLSLADNHFGYNEIKIISELIGTNKFLKQIDLSGNDIGDKALEVLCPALQSSNIEELNLGYNDIGDKGARVIANLIRNNKFIAILDLELGNIKADGAIAIALAIKGSSLASLNLSNNYLGVEAVNILDLAAKANGTLLGVAYCVALNFEKQVETLAPSLIKTAKTLKAKIRSSYTPSQDVTDNLAKIMDISSIGLVMNIVNKIVEYDEKTQKTEKYLLNVRDANAYARQSNLKEETVDLDVFLQDDKNYESLSAVERPCENMSLSDFLDDEKKESSPGAIRKPSTTLYQPVAKQSFISKLFGGSKTNH